MYTVNVYDLFSPAFILGGVFESSYSLPDSLELSTRDKVSIQKSMDELPRYIPDTVYTAKYKIIISH